MDEFRQFLRVVAYAVRDDMRMAVQASFWVAVVLVVACEVPNDEGFVPAAGEEHVWVLKAGCE